MLKILNIKEGYPDSDYAIYLLDHEIAISRFSPEVKALAVIHGYGSHGVGGVIRSRVHEYLASMKKEGKIIDYFPGDAWDETSPRVKELTKSVPECIVSENLRLPNSGITIVRLAR